MVYSGDEVKLARTVVRAPEVEKWNKDLLAAVKLTPVELHQARDAEVVFKEKVDVEAREFADKPMVSRNIYLKATDFEEFGLTRGCPTCEHFRRYDAWGTRPHSIICRSYYDGVVQNCRGTCALRRGGRKAGQDC